MTILISLSDNSNLYIVFGLLLILAIIIIVAIITKTKKEKHLSSSDSEIASIIDTISWSLAREDLEEKSEAEQDHLQTGSDLGRSVSGKTYEEYRYDVSAYLNNHQAEINDFMQRNGYTYKSRHLTSGERYEIIAFIRKAYEDEVQKINRRNKASSWVSIEYIRELYNRTQGDFVGVYVFHNLNNDKYYVGQAKRVLFRLNQHLTGNGNPEIYQDYLNNHIFEIHIEKLIESGYEDLDKLERELIAAFDSYHSGYNKNAGNGFSDY